MNENIRWQTKIEAIKREIGKEWLQNQQKEQQKLCHEMESVHDGRKVHGNSKESEHFYWFVPTEQCV